MATLASDVGSPAWRNHAGLGRANLIALLVPAVLLAGAWGSQLFGGLIPCEMCHWQRWPHYAALPIAALAFVVPQPWLRRALVALAAVAIAASGVIGVLHAGVEWHWWNGFTSCTQETSTAGMTTDQMLKAILNAPVIRCDTAQWRFAGVSLAGWNALFSLGAAAAIGWLLARRRAA